MKKQDQYRRPKGGYLFFSYAILIGWLCIGCESTSKEPQQWQIKASENFNLYPIVHKEKVILPGKCGGLDCLKAVRLDTGAPLWDWLDRDSVLHRCYYNLQHYIFDDILMLPIGSSLIAINLANGKTLWQDQKNWPAESFLEGIGARVFRTYYDNRNRQARLLAFDIYTGDSRQLKVFPIPAAGKLLVRTPAIAVLEGQDTVCISSTIHYIPKQMTNSQLISWRLNDTSFQKTIQIYPDNLNGDGVTKQGIVDGIISYWVAGQQIVAINLKSQKELWRDTFPHGMLTSRLLLDDGRLFYACENEALYALDAENGGIIWECPIAGTPSRVYVNRDKIYLVGGSDGNLYVIDKNKGTLRFKYHSTDLALKVNRSLRRTFYAGNDKVIVTDFRNWYAFDIQPGQGIKVEGIPAKER